MSAGIYKISTPTKFYFGSSINLDKRWDQHVRLLRRGAHKNPIMQASFDKYGEEAFTFEVVDTCSPDETFEVEQLYLDLVVGVPGCMNIGTHAVNGMKGRKHTEETKALISEMKKGLPGVGSKPVVGYYKGDLVYEWPSAAAAERELGLSSGMARSICRGKNAQLGCGRYRNSKYSHLKGLELFYVEQ